MASLSIPVDVCRINNFFLAVHFHCEERRRNVSSIVVEVLLVVVRCVAEENEGVEEEVYRKHV